MRVEGRTALVTGGCSGLGRATAELLVQRGARVAVLDLPNAAGSEVVDAWDGAGVFAPGDVTSEADVQAAIETTVRRFGGLHIVVNCAGIGGPRRLVGKDGPMPLEHFRRCVEINLIGTFNVMRLTAARMATQEPQDGERGVIVNTASIAAFDGQIGQIGYAASKAGIVGMTLPAARDLASLLIRCVTIAPGTFDTPMLARHSQEVRDRLAAQIPHPRRLGQPSEYAQLALQIVENPMLNGATIRLDGALRMAPS